MVNFEIAAIAGVILSLAFKYIPGLSGWYEGKAPEYKELIMLGIMFVAVGGAYGLSCYGWLDVYACGMAGLRDAVFSFVIAVVGNQGAYLALSHQKE